MEQPTGSALVPQEVQNKKAVQETDFCESLRQTEQRMPPAGKRVKEFVASCGFSFGLTISSLLLPVPLSGGQKHIKGVEALPCAVAGAWMNQTAGGLSEPTSCLKTP